MLTHVPILGRGGGSINSSTRTGGDMTGITASRSNSSAATLMSPPRGARPAAQDPAFPAGGETTTISLPPASALSSVSPRSAPLPAYCISLVSTTTTTTTQANHDGPGSHPPTPPHPCREQDQHHHHHPHPLPLSEHLASLPGGPTRHGYTGLVTHAPPSPVQPRSPPSSGALAAAAAAAATTGRPQPSHRTTAGEMGSAHATTTTTTPPAAPSNTAPAAADDAAAVILATSTMCTSGGGPSLLPSASSVRTLLNTAAPHMDLDEGTRVVPLPATHHRLQRTYELRPAPAPAARDRDHGGAAHDVLVLTLAPPSMLRLLRSEQWVIKSEAVVVRWIRGVLSGGGGGGGGGGGVAKAKADLGCPDVVCGSCGTKRQYCQARVQDELFLGGGGRRGDGGDDDDVDLLALLPGLVDHSQSGAELGSAYNILSHPGGLPLSSLPGGLAPAERKHLGFQAGRLARRLSLLRSPSGKFGPAISVLCPTATTTSTSTTTTAAAAVFGEEKPGGADRWSVAFHAALEGILRDAEDMAVTISYQAIRRHFRRLRPCLDAVTVARLVVLDAAHDSNVMAERGRRLVVVPARRGGGESQAVAGPTGRVAGPGGGHGDGRCAADIRVTGLRDWGNCTFGDPLMGMVFSEDPSREFLRGFSGRRQQSEDDDDDDNNDLLTMCGDIIEYPEEAHIRLLLYQCYHATVAVVKEFYRPQSDSTNRELAARKRLHAVLARLEDVEDDPKRRHARPRGEMSPAKKPKTAAEGEDNDYFD